MCEEADKQQGCYLYFETLGHKSQKMKKQKRNNIRGRNPYQNTSGPSEWSRNCVTIAKGTDQQDGTRRTHIAPFGDHHPVEPEVNRNQHQKTKGKVKKKR